MGLDMYAWTVPASVAGNSQVDFHTPESLSTLEDGLAYWRKFNHLHGWMEHLYRTKGGTREFNCTSVRLMANDLDDLELDIANNRLVFSHGFFFGGDELHPQDLETAQKFILDAHFAIDHDKAVFYSSWW